MGTQGMISITRSGVVVAKIVTGCDGQRIPALAASLRENPVTDEAALLSRCHEHDLASDSVVVQTSPERILTYDGHEEAPPLYREKFHDRFFNPRWDNGTTTYLEVADLDAYPHKGNEESRLLKLCGSLLEDLQQRVEDRANSSLPEWELEAKALGVRVADSPRAKDDPEEAPPLYREKFREWELEAKALRVRVPDSPAPKDAPVDIQAQMLANCASYAAEREHNAMMALSYRADRDALMTAVVPLLAAAAGLSMGEDWNKGTHAGKHGHRKKLLECLPAAEAVVARIQRTQEEERKCKTAQ